MSQARCGSSLPSSGNRLSTCQDARTVSAAVGVVIALVTTIGDRTVTAQASAPAVRVVRDVTMSNRVWPADLNGDGITDLVSSSEVRCGGGTCSGGKIQVAIGRGDGTFNAPVESSSFGVVLGAADFNGDGKVDVIAAASGTNGNFTIALLPGTGTAAVGAPVPVPSFGPDDFLFAASADLNGDGKRDLVASDGSGISVFPGNGDFTFGAPVKLTTGIQPADVIIADLNGDGRRDIVTANNFGASISVFLNKGSLLFSAMDTALAGFATDVTTADLNRDGRPDLLVSTGRPHDLFGGDAYGFALVLLGRGDGTFQAPVAYPVLPGAQQIVTLDWNKDGIPDVITGNRSSIIHDDCSVPWKTWDSISILLGTADGRLEGPWNFSIGDQALQDPSDPNVNRFRNTLVSLNTSDLNRDGRVDLIASFGALLFNLPPVTNRAPTVTFGPDQVILNTHETVLRPTASDPDDDVLIWEIRDEGGTVWDSPNVCGQILHEGRNTFTVTVNDGHGHIASDTVVYTVVMTDGGPGVFAAGTDIGAVGAAGSDSYDTNTGVYTVRGSGADIWGTADEFHYVWTQGGGDFQITARIDGVQNVAAWTKAGVMIRESLNAGARHAFLLASPGKGVAFQRRTVEDGASVNTAGPATTAPVWVKLSRVGDVITAYYRKTTTDFWTVVGSETLAGLGSDVLVGLAVSSHADGSVATATFSNVVVELATPWVGRPIGAATGSVTTDGVLFTTTGKGPDIWGSADAFYFVSFSWPVGDVTITARVKGVSNAHAWSKAGVMIRESLSAGSKHVMMVVTPGKGIAMQYRKSTGGDSAQAAQVPGVAPAWVRLVKHIDTVTASWSTDGEHWTTLGSTSVAFAGNTFYIGLPITSHNTGAFTTATFDDVRVGL